MITLQNASRWYKQVMGINDITCEIGPGITALLGPNGADYRSAATDDRQCPRVRPCALCQSCRV